MSSASAPFNFVSLCSHYMFLPSLSRLLIYFLNVDPSHSHQLAPSGNSCSPCSTSSLGCVCDGEEDLAPRYHNVDDNWCVLGVRNISRCLCTDLATFSGDENSGTLSVSSTISVRFELAVIIVLGRHLYCYILYNILRRHRGGIGSQKGDVSGD